MSRKIIHIDMDAFFASVEQNDFVEYRSKPIAVGGSGRRGVVATASYEARKYGVKSAMPGYKAKELCPHLIFVKPRFSRYKEVSKEIRNVFEEYTDLIEPLSLDEAYLDVSHNFKGEKSAIQIAKDIKTEIKKRTGLTASAGVSINKFLAKIASDLHKPNGLTVILPKDIHKFIDQLPVRKFFGVGKVMHTKLTNFRISTGADIKQYTEIELVKQFGKMGRYLYKMAHGIDDRPVKPERIRKSISVEWTFEENLSDFETVKHQLRRLLSDLDTHLTRLNKRGKTIVLKIRYDDFKTITRSKSLATFTSNAEIINDVVFSLFENLHWDQKPIRLLGIGLTNLEYPENLLQLKMDF